MIKVEQKELLEAVKDMLNPFLYATQCEKGEDVLLDGEIYNIPMALIEISKALNRIADEMGKK